MADLYRESIIREFPESQPALILTNPNFAEELLARENAVNIYYEQTYEKYRLGYYQQVMDDADTAMIRYKDDPLLDKFKYLKVLSIGRTQDILVFTQALDSLANSSTDSEVIQSARDILAYIMASDEEVKTETQKIEAEEIYNSDSTGSFFYGMFLDPVVDINQLKFEFINFNLDHYSNRTFDVVHEVLGDGELLMLIKEFPDLTGAWEYFDSVAPDPQIFNLVKEGEYKNLVISLPNASILIQDGEAQKYWLFFQKHYER